MAAAHIGASWKHLINILLSRQNEPRIVFSKMSSSSSVKIALGDQI